MHIHQLSYHDTHLLPGLNLLLDNPWDLEQGQRFLANPDNALFLALEEDKPVGHLIAYRLQRWDALRAGVLLYGIEVDPHYQRRGIGKDLIEACKEWARSVGAYEVWVLMEQSNPAAVALYKSTGGVEESPGTMLFVYDLTTG
jgi:GNAT superfamily N-acetyltransferase